MISVAKSALHQQRICPERLVRGVSARKRTVCQTFTDTLYLLPRKYENKSFATCAKLYNKGCYETKGVPGCLFQGDQAILCLVI